jgi:DNA polymerase III alpha subunit
MTEGANPLLGILPAAPDQRCTYVELHARSAFSFLEGASLPEELGIRCAKLEQPAMALSDAHGVYGAPRFHTAARKLGIRALIGAVSDIGPSILEPAISVTAYKNFAVTKSARTRTGSVFG